MSQLSSQNCPVCGATIPSRILRKRIGGFFSALSPRLGIKCENCKSALKVDGRRTALLIATTYLFFIAFAIIVRNPDHKRLSLLQMTGGIPLLLAYIYGSLLVRLRTANPGEQLNFSDDPWENIEHELAPKRKQAEMEARLEDERIAEINSPARKPWTCVGCSAENPASFDICWQCERTQNDK